VLYFASMECMRSGPVEDIDENYGGYDGGGHHTISDTHDSHLKLTRVVDIAGVELAQDLDIDEDCLLDEEDPDEPDDEDYQDWTGNAGAEATHW
jgi:hypothetical protein